MELHGLQEHPEQQIISMVSTMETVPSLWWVVKEPSSPHLMESLGLQGLRGHQSNSQESTTKNNPLKPTPSSPLSNPH